MRRFVAAKPFYVYTVKEHLREDSVVFCDRFESVASEIGERGPDKLDVLFETIPANQLLPEPTPEMKVLGE